MQNPNKSFRKKECAQKDNNINRQVQNPCIARFEVELGGMFIFLCVLFFRLKELKRFLH